LGPEETITSLAKANEVRWYEHVLRRNEGHALNEALHFRIEGLRKRGRPKMTCQRK